MNTDIREEKEFERGMKRSRWQHNPRRVAWALLALAACALFSWCEMIYASEQAKKPKTPKETYTRPKPTVPIKPQIPSINRYQKDKVFLEQADSLYRRESDGYEHQIVAGNVKFRQGNMWMFCDSAYYYPEFNSLNAYGHVKMEQGDTLFVYADRLFYNGQSKMAKLRCGPTDRTVRLINRNVKLTTDSLDYNLGQQLGWYEHGGTLNDGLNTLTSVYGNYSPRTKEAEFRNDVVLVNNKDGYRLTTDILHYNTATKIARIDAPTLIEGRNDVIHATSGWYNTRTDNAVLTSRSLIEHTDSAGNVTTLDGDSIIYDKAHRISRAYMFNGPHGKPMVITDTARKAVLTGGFGQYNDLTREAMATQYPLLIEYSRPDTIFLRADTILSFVRTEMVFPPEVLLRVLRQNEALRRGAIEAARERGDTVAELPPPIEPDSSEMIPKDFYTAKALYNARFFNQSAQGVADSIVYTQIDSMARLFVKPVVWSGERQVTGTRIDIHLNDSTADRAFIPDKAFLAEHVEEDFYNQLSGKQLNAYFENNNLRHLMMEQNVVALMLPQDNDSTYSKVVMAESTYLTIDLEDKRLEKLKMWPDVTGTVTPLFLVTKRDQRLLPGFTWLEAIRPKRSWYGDVWHWDDELGVVPDELIRYFGREP